MRMEEAYDAIVESLARVATLTPSDLENHRTSNSFHDLWVPNAAWNAMRSRDGGFVAFTDMRDEQFRPFYEAAWELCRIGVLRPGAFAPKGQERGKWSLYR
jgi:hypothetical protein